MSLKVNFSGEEASSEARDFEPLPSGKYGVRITDVELRECGPNSKNAGKPYWNIEFTVQEGNHENRRLWSNCMLFEGALYTLAQLLKATGNEQALESGEVPEPDVFIGSPVTVNVRKERDNYREERDGSDEPLWKNEVKGIKAPAGDGASKEGSTLLP